MNDEKNNGLLNVKWNIFSEQRTALYGICILWIMIYHAYEMHIDKLSSMPFIKSVLKHGNSGVEIFFLLAGISSYYSFKKNPNIKRYYKKRIVRIMTPVILVDWTYWGVTCMTEGRGISWFLKEITFYAFWSGGGDIQVWYIATLLLLYFMFPFIYRYLENDQKRKYRVLCLIGVQYVLCFLMYYTAHGQIRSWYGSTEIALMRLPSFFLGVYFGKKAYDENKVSSRYLKVSFAISLLILLEFYYKILPVNSLYRIVYFIMIFGLPLWMCIFLKYHFSPNGKIYRMLVFAGQRSLELYLVHVIVRRVYWGSSLFIAESGHDTENLIAYFLIVGCFSVIVAEGVYRISNRLTKKILQKNCL